MQNINLSSGDIAKKYKDLPQSTIRGWRGRHHISVPRCIDFDAIDIDELQEKYNECKNLGDGTISEDGIISIVGYMSNMKKIQNFLNKFNILSTITVDKRRKYRKNDFGDNFVMLCFSNKTSSYSLAKMLYYNVDDLYLTRKKNRADKFIQQIEESDYVRDKQIVIYYKNAVLRLRDAMS